MAKEIFNLRSYNVESILGFIESKEFAIPEIQRPFVWDNTQVKELIDSLYNGFPCGYIIIWQNPTIKTKDGKNSNGRKILIDGQQRVTALMTAIKGFEVLNEDFQKKKIKIAFNPFPTSEDKRFEVQTASTLNDKKWIPDISEIFSNGFKIRQFEKEYCELNPNISEDDLDAEIEKLKEIKNRTFGVIELDQALDIKIVTEIFIRINSKGTALKQEDFVMSTLGSDSQHGGEILRKVVDYFAHLVKKPQFFEQLQNDAVFKQSDFYNQIKWLSNESNDIYCPDFGDILRVAFIVEFNRGRLQDLVSLLSGRDFKTKEYTEQVMTDSYAKLKKGLSKFVNEYNYKNFTSILKGAGFAYQDLLKSSMTVDFAYALYLILQNDNTISKDQIKRYVQKWFVLSVLTSRYIGSPETKMDEDIRNIQEKGFLKFFNDIEESNLSETFWQTGLPQELETSSTNSPGFKVFLSAQCYNNASSFLMKGFEVKDIIESIGDIHHIFPRAYLKKNGIDVKTKYNQIANMVYLDTQVNKIIGEQPPKKYMGIVKEQIKDNTITKKLGNILSENDLKKNFQENAIPENLISCDVKDYNNFLIERRKLMAKYIEDYYKSL